MRIYLGRGAPYNFIECLGACIAACEEYLSGGTWISLDLHLFSKGYPLGVHWMPLGLHLVYKGCPLGCTWDSLDLHIFWKGYPLQVHEDCIRCVPLQQWVNLTALDSHLFFQGHPLWFDLNSWILFLLQRAPLEIHLYFKRLELVSQQAPLRISLDLFGTASFLQGA
jgi:hypothetical protein